MIVTCPCSQALVREKERLQAQLDKAASSTEALRQELGLVKAELATTKVRAH